MNLSVEEAWCEIVLGGNFDWNSQFLKYFKFNHVKLDLSLTYARTEHLAG